VTGDGRNPKEEECLRINRCALSVGEPARLIPEFMICRDPCSHQGLRFPPGAGVGGRGLRRHVGRRFSNTDRKSRSHPSIEETSGNSRSLGVNLVSCLLKSK
jgi:hypothetical protein